MKNSIKHVIRFVILSAFLLVAFVPRTVMADTGVSGILSKSGNSVKIYVSIPESTTEDIATLHVHAYAELITGAYKGDPEFDLSSGLSGVMSVTTDVIDKNKDGYKYAMVDIILSDTKNLFEASKGKQEPIPLELGTLTLAPDNSRDDFRATVSFVSVKHEGNTTTDNEPCVEYVTLGGTMVTEPMSSVDVAEISYAKGESTTPSGGSGGGGIPATPTPSVSPTPTPTPTGTPAPAGSGLKLNEHQVKGLKNRTTGSQDCTLRLDSLEEDASNLTFEYESSDKSVVKVVKPGVLRYMGVGEATVTVTATSKVTGKVYTLKIQVVVKKPGAPTFTPTNKIKKTKSTFTVTTSTVRGADGFQVQYSLKNLKKTTKGAKTKSFAGIDKKLVRGVVTTNKSKRTYYVRVRAYQVVNGKKVYSAWSAVKTTKSR